MIVSKTVEQREAALAKLLPMQRGDFEGIYEAMEGYPVTIRLLDPPLHEFLPHEEDDIVALASEMNISVEELKSVIDSLHEFNPMMGHRGCRLDVTYPEIGAMQTRAIIEAAINVQKRHPEWKLVPEIMIPLVGEVKEFNFVKQIITSTADAIIAESGVALEYLVGTMIEIPRAALTADEIAKDAQFFSFGTNDLTQMTFGFSRDDAGKFLDAYYDKKIYENDPFARLDTVGVGRLMKTAVELGKGARPTSSSGICGDTVANSSSIEFLPEHRAELRVLLTVPRAGGPPRGGSVGAAEQHQPRLTSAAGRRWPGPLWGRAIAMLRGNVNAALGAIRTLKSQDCLLARKNPGPEKIKRRGKAAEPRSVVPVRDACTV